jgi:hypothetical protein
VISIAVGLDVTFQDFGMNHVLLRAMWGVLIASPFIVFISYLMAIFDRACGGIRCKHAYRPGPR